MMNMDVYMEMEMFYCNTCDGAGYVYPDKIPKEEYLKRNKKE